MSDAQKTIESLINEINTLRTKNEKLAQETQKLTTDKVALLKGLLNTGATLKEHYKDAHSLIAYVHKATEPYFDYEKNKML